MFFGWGTLLNPSRSSPWSWCWWCSLHWRLCWCCPSCRYPQDDHCGWRVSRVNGQYMKSRYHRQDKLVQGIGSQLQGQLFRLDDSLDVGSPTRLCWFLSYSPRLHNPRSQAHPSRGRVSPGEKPLEGAVWNSWPRCFHFYHCFGDISLGSDPWGCDENRFEGCENPKIWDISYLAQGCGNGIQSQIELSNH